MSKYTCAGQGELGHRLTEAGARWPGAGASQRGDKETLCLVGRPDVRSAAVGLEEEIASVQSGVSWSVPTFCGLSSRSTVRLRSNTSPIASFESWFRYIGIGIKPRGLVWHAFREEQATTLLLATRGRSNRDLEKVVASGRAADPLVCKSWFPMWC
jgi:hypothetical protein